MKLKGAVTMPAVQAGANAGAGVSAGVGANATAGAKAGTETKAAASDSKSVKTGGKLQVKLP
jgi:hypothetical protein